MMSKALFLSGLILCRVNILQGDKVDNEYFISY